MIRTLAILTLLIVTLGQASAQFDFQTYLITGEPAPGTNPGVTFTDFFNDVLSPSGAVATVGSLVGPGVVPANNRGLWSDASGSLDLIVRTGDNAPSTSSQFQFFSSLGLNSSGDTKFFAGLTGGAANPANDSSLWLQTGGALELVAREGSAAPGGDNTGQVFGFFSKSLLNEAGDVAFNASLTGTGVNGSNDFGLWIRSGSTLELVAREGNPAPGTPPGVLFSSAALDGFNASGNVVFDARFTGAGVMPANDEGIYIGSVGALELVIREGQNAPGLGPSVQFGNLQSPALNASNEIAFASDLVGLGVTPTNDAAIWKRSGGSLQLVLQSGAPVPAVPGFIFDEFDQVQLNSAGEVSFYARLTDDGGAGNTLNSLWFTSAGTPTLLGVEGGQAPGTGPGVVFDGFEDDDTSINAFGDVAFRGELTGTGVTSSNDQGIWVRTAEGGVQLLVRTGDQFDVNDDPLIEDLRIISQANLSLGSGGEDSELSGINGRREILLQLRFADGSEGLFTVTVIPEPSSLALLGLFISGLPALRSRTKRSEL